MGKEKREARPEEDRTKLEKSTSDSLDAIDHIAVVVDDLESTVNWYQSRFSCELDYKDDTWAMLKFGNISMAFVVSHQHPAHVGIVREDAEKYGVLKEHRDGSKSCYLRDPSGNIVEILLPYESGK